MGIQRNALHDCIKQLQQMAITDQQTKINQNFTNLAKHDLLLEKPVFVNMYGKFSQLIRALGVQEKTQKRV